jgi:hypothetical protein
MVGVEGQVLRAGGVEGVEGGGVVEGVGGGSGVEGVGGGVGTPVIYPLMLLLFWTWVFCLHSSSPDKDKVIAAYEICTIILFEKGDEIRTTGR